MQDLNQLPVISHYNISKLSMISVYKHTQPFVEIVQQAFMSKVSLILPDIISAKTRIIF